ncbi:MAG: hypothetical protein BWZ08_02226 [candidate division BRC1 bacterium ADurb.BinA292]|nr:MAG: hypothetical protein BWZ08_02226 [candidate division BRC1 bacterium ADurb.BinA292]
MLAHVRRDLARPPVAILRAQPAPHQRGRVGPALIIQAQRRDQEIDVLVRLIDAGRQQPAAARRRAGQRQQVLRRRRRPLRRTLARPQRDAAHPPAAQPGHLQIVTGLLARHDDVGPAPAQPRQEKVLVAPLGQRPVAQVEQVVERDQLVARAGQRQVVMRVVQQVDPWQRGIAEEARRAVDRRLEVDPAADLQPRRDPVAQPLRPDQRQHQRQPQPRVGRQQLAHIRADAAHRPEPDVQGDVEPRVRGWSGRRRLRETSKQSGHG